VHTAHLDPLLTGEDDHTDRVGTPPADHHTIVAVDVPYRVRAQQAVRIVVLTSDQTLKVHTVHRHSEMSR
jgi:hypothetical protein